MADQQDQFLLGGPVEKASASADASNLRGKSSGTNNIRKRHNTGGGYTTISDKRRKQTDTSTASAINRRRTIETSKPEGKNNWALLKSSNKLLILKQKYYQTQSNVQTEFSDTNLRQTRQQSTNTRKSIAKQSETTPIDCVASRTRSRTPQYPNCGQLNHIDNKLIRDSSILRGKGIF